MRVESDKTKRLLLEIDRLIRERVFVRLKKSTNWRTIEQNHAYNVMKSMHILEKDLVHLSKGKPIHRKGRASSTSADQKMRILLVKQLLGESNRKMMYMLVIFSALSGIYLGYKNIERFYSDPEVYNMLLEFKELLYSRY